VPDSYAGVMKASTAADTKRLEDIPNVGPKIAANLRQLGFEESRALAGQDPYALYERLCAETGVRHDPCLLDTFIAAVRFMDGGPAVPWWSFTPERKHAMTSRGTPA
jgi:Pathogenicity locus